MPSIIDRWKYKCRFLPFRNQTHWCLWASVNMGIRVYFTATLSMPSSSALWLESFRTTILLYAVTQPQYHASLVVKLLIKSLVFRCKAWKHFSNSIENICLFASWLVGSVRSVDWLIVLERTLYFEQTECAAKYERYRMSKREQANGSQLYRRITRLKMNSHQTLGGGTSVSWISPMGSESNRAIGRAKKTTQPR